MCVCVSITVIIRGGVRAFGFVRSEAELDQLAYELYEQEEVKQLIIAMFHLATLLAGC